MKTKKCSKCGVEYAPTVSRQKYCVPCGSEHNREYNREYATKYQQAPEHKAKAREYRQTPKYKETARAWRSTVRVRSAPWFRENFRSLHPLRGWVTKDGYIVLRFKGRNERGEACRYRCLEQTFIMAKHIGRVPDYSKGETVHHKNGNRQDNRLENLELHPKGHRNIALLKELERLRNLLTEHRISYESTTAKT